MQSYKERMAEQEAQSHADCHNGATNFPESQRFPKTKHNKLAVYSVTWTMTTGRRAGKPTGNYWTSRAKAIQVMRDKQREGTFLGTTTKYFAGFAF